MDEPPCCGRITLISPETWNFEVEVNRNLRGDPEGAGESEPRRRRAHPGHVDVVVVRQRVQHLHDGGLHQLQREPADASAPAGDTRRLSEEPPAHQQVAVARCKEEREGGGGATLTRPR